MDKFVNPTKPRTNENSANQEIIQKTAWVQHNITGYLKGFVVLLNQKLRFHYRPMRHFQGVPSVYANAIHGQVYMQTQYMSEYQNI